VWDSTCRDGEVGVVFVDGNDGVFGECDGTAQILQSSSLSSRSSRVVPWEPGKSDNFRTRRVWWWREMKVLNSQNDLLLSCGCTCAEIYKYIQPKMYDRGLMNSMADEFFLLAHMGNDIHFMINLMIFSIVLHKKKVCAIFHHRPI